MNFLGVVTRPSSGLKDKRDQVNARVPVELFLFFAFGHNALDENNVTIAVSMWHVLPRRSKITSMRAPFRLRTGLGDSGKTWDDGLLDVDLGAGVRGDPGLPCGVAGEIVGR